LNLPEGGGNNYLRTKGNELQMNPNSCSRSV